MATMEKDRALGRGQFRVRVYVVLEAIIGTYSRGDREILFDTDMAAAWEDAGHFLGVLFICPICG